MTNPNATGNTFLIIYPSVTGTWVIREIGDVHAQEEICCGWSFFILTGRLKLMFTTCSIGLEWEKVVWVIFYIKDTIHIHK